MTLKQSPSDKSLWLDDGGEWFRVEANPFALYSVLSQDIPDDLTDPELPVESKVRDALIRMLGKVSGLRVSP